MRKGDQAKLTIKKYLRKCYEKEYSACTATVWKYDSKEGYVYIKDLKIGGYRILIRGAYNE